MQIGNTRYRGGPAAGQRDQQAMDELTNRVKNVHLRTRVPAAKPVENAADKVIKEASALESTGDMAEALKLIDAAVEEDVEPVHKLKQYGHCQIGVAPCVQQMFHCYSRPTDSEAIHTAGSN